MLEFRLLIAADHPSLPGHFPGQPVVPGVVILDEVSAHAIAAERSSVPHARMVNRGSRDEVSWRESPMPRQSQVSVSNPFRARNSAKGT